MVVSIKYKFLVLGFSFNQFKTIKPLYSLLYFLYDTHSTAIIFWILAPDSWILNSIFTKYD